MAEDNLRPVMKSTHYIVGTTYETGNFLIDIESYYKLTTGIQEYITVSPSILPNINSSIREVRGTQNYQSNPLDSIALKPSYFFTGDGKSYGIDFALRYKYKMFTSWLSYSLSKSTHIFPNLNYGNEIPSPSDQTHQLSLANMINIGKWNFGSITLFSTGRPYISNTENINNIPVIRYYNRLPDYFRTDVSANYNFNLKRVKFKTGVTIVNILNTKNYYDIHTRKFEFDDPNLSTTNITPAQNLSLNVFLNFVF
jgi:ferric enterobactin receptor